jgi:hypothetical protein
LAAIKNSKGDVLAGLFVEAGKSRKRSMAQLVAHRCELTDGPDAGANAVLAVGTTDKESPGHQLCNNSVRTRHRKK